MQPSQERILVNIFFSSIKFMYYPDIKYKTYCYKIILFANDQDLKTRIIVHRAF